MMELDDISVLLVEDDEDVRVSAAQALELSGFSVVAASSVEAVSPAVLSDPALVVVCDVKLPGLSGIDWLKDLQKFDRELPVILMTGHGDIAMAVQAMRDGAYDFLAKPFPTEYLTAVVRRAVEKRHLMLQVRALQRRLDDTESLEGTLIGRSDCIQRVRSLILNLAPTNADVIIYGETGCGKDVVARCLHSHSERRQANFVALNCGGLPEALVESELFGHEAGAFTGAVRARAGKFEHANGGTLFLDEIESMPLAVQVKLLRTLQERKIERLGSNRHVDIDCRVVAASKEDLRALSDANKFRSDLYYRLGVAFIELPPLRERREDVPLLFEHFTRVAAARQGRAVPVLPSSMIGDLIAYSWPGNVRELRNVAERFVLGLPALHLSEGALARGGYGFSEQVQRFERVVLEDELRRQQGDVGAVAKSLLMPKVLVPVQT